MCDVGDEEGEKQRPRRRCVDGGDLWVRVNPLRDEYLDTFRPAEESVYQRNQSINESLSWNPIISHCTRQYLNTPPKSCLNAAVNQTRSM
ncbi:hypothetical protein ACRALDRAFT_208615 [Sodiomyces alcalophilus JCM 7366]|uniref:uncharacterized protein n=1 Tax=Sodiomyces alcalophilus JCM 7366 TaxID=591952 RepID=UPI0039B58B04